MITDKALRDKDSADKKASSPQAFGKNDINNQRRNSDAQGNPIDTVEKLLQTHINDFEALEKIVYVTVNGVQIAVDPIEGTQFKTTGKDKMSFDKTLVGIKDGNGDKETYPYFDMRQILQCRASKHNLKILHRELDDRSKIESF